MPRIDPQQLLKTLGVLLAPSGGIKSPEEVVRLVQLMQKFSRKLVSKCIYIQILRATSPDLLEKFLGEKGWELLNQWFVDALKTQNWPLCRELIQLFEMCPISAERLKENVEPNSTPRLINQLRQDINVDESTRDLASAVYEKWVEVVTPPQHAIIEPVVPPARGRGRGRGRGAGTRGRGRGRGRGAAKAAPVALSRESIEDDYSTSDEEEKKSEPNGDVKQPVKITIKLGGQEDGQTKPVIIKSDAKPEQEDGSISLLQSLADEVVESIKKEDVKPNEASDHKEKDENEEPEAKKAKITDSKDRRSSSSSDKSSRDRREREREKRKAEKEKERLRRKEDKKYRPHPRDEVDPEEKSRIKQLAKKLKEEAQAKKDKETLSKITASSSTLSRIPKIPKKAPSSEEKDKASAGGVSFADMLGELDTKPKTVKTPLNKNKTQALLEGLSSDKPKPKDSKLPSSSSKKDSGSSSSSSSSSSSKHHHHHHHHRGRHHSSHRDKDRKGSSSSSSLSKKESPSSKKSDDKKPSSLHIPERKRSSDLSESPKSKYSPKGSFAESNSFMDAIFNTMNQNVPRKKKRRLSESENKTPPKTEKSESSPSGDAKKAKVEAESKDKENEEEEENQAPTFSFYRDTLESNETGQNNGKEEDKGGHGEKEDDDRNEKSPEKEGSDKSCDNEDLPFEEPDNMPREVKGILVYHRGLKKRNKRIQWKTETDLVAIKYFELDEDERVNVNRLKFANLQEREKQLEKAALKSKGHIDEESDFPIIKWYTPRLIDTGSAEPPFVPGTGSREKDIQFAREKNVLQALYFTREMTPDTPAEPEPENHAREPVKHIPLVDEESPEDDQYNYVSKPWPEPKVCQIDRDVESQQNLPTALSNLLSSIGSGNGLQSFLSQSANLSQEEQSVLAAQTQAMQQMGMLPGNMPPQQPQPYPPPGMDMGYPPMQGGYDHGGMIPPPMQGMPFPPNGMPYPPNNFPPHRGGYPNGRGFRGGPRGNYRGGPPPSNGRDNRDFRGGKDRNIDSKIRTRPCRFFANGGFCRDGDRCRYIHDQSSG